MVVVPAVMARRRVCRLAQQQRQLDSANTALSYGTAGMASPHAMPQQSSLLPSLSLSLSLWVRLSVCLVFPPRVFLSRVSASHLLQAVAAAVSHSPPPRLSPLLSLSIHQLRQFPCQVGFPEPAPIFKPDLPP